jgi:hypothetical protein
VGDITRHDSALNYRSMRRRRRSPYIIMLKYTALFLFVFLAGGCFIINLMAGMFLSEEPIVFAGCIHIGVAFYRTPPSYDWFFCSFPFLIALKVVESLTACIISNPAPVSCHRNHEVVRATLSSCVCV